MEVTSKPTTLTHFWLQRAHHFMIQCFHISFLIFGAYIFNIPKVQSKSKAGRRKHNTEKDKDKDKERDKDKQKRQRDREAEEEVDRRPPRQRQTLKVQKVQKAREAEEEEEDDDELEGAEGDIPSTGQHSHSMSNRCLLLHS